MSRRKKKLQDIRAAKDRRAKKMAIGGAVLLVAILAFEMPHYLGGKSSPSAAGTTGSSTTPGSTTPGATATPAATAPGTAAAAAMPVSATASTKLPNSDVAPTRTKSQLYSFDTFAGKDPFVQQVQTTPTTPSGSPSGSSPVGTSAPAPASSPAPAPAPAPAQQTSARTLASNGVATIEVNGKSETVRVGKSFPSANPVFMLVSISHGVANVGIANGSYTSGAQTVRLSSGRSMTLVDTADGVRYTLRLLSAS